MLVLRVLPLKLAWWAWSAGESGRPPDGYETSYDAQAWRPSG